MRLIDANDFRAYLEDARQICLEEDTFGGNFATEVIRVVGEYLSKFPTVDAEPVRHGHWIPKYIPTEGLGNSTHKLVYVCDQCGRKEPQMEPYCHCGAKMDEGDENAADCTDGCKLETIRDNE